jgi:surface polysaccharide O-acyltransferase-like enzyme
MSVPIWKAIAPLRGLAMLAVVMNHSIQMAPTSYLLGPEPLRPAEHPVAFGVMSVLRGLTPVALHLFLAVSGFVSFRFFRGPAESWTTARVTLRKYLTWAVPLTLLLAVHERHFDLEAMALGLLVGGPMSAYWFLILIVMLYGLAPWLVSGVKQHPKRMGALAFGVQALTCAVFYARDGRALGAMWLWPVVRCVQFLPFFLLGMWAARDADVVGAWLAGHRLSIRVACVGLALLAIAESALISQRHGFVIFPSGPMYALERVSMPLLSAALLGWLCSVELKPAWLLHWLAQVGTHSLGILLMMDLFHRFVIVSIWQLPRFVSAAAAAAFAQHQLPVVVTSHGLWLMPVFFVAGVWGPLYLIDWAHRLFGNRVRLLF